MSKKEEAYALIVVLLFAAVVSTLSIYFTYIIRREYEIIQAQEDNISEKFIITAIEEIIKKEVGQSAEEELKDNSLTEQDLVVFRRRINSRDNKIDLSGNQFAYQIKEVFDLNARVNLNQVKAEKLELLPEVGETLSQRIVDNRRYKQLDELKKLKSLGETTFAEIKSLVTVYGSEKININTANDVAWKIMDQRLGFKLSEQIFENQSYSNFEDLLAIIDDEQQEKLENRGQEVIKFNSSLIGIEYEIINLESKDRFSEEKVIEL